jgi:hypothetical protein
MAQTDWENLRDRVLQSLGLGTQLAGYKTARKALNKLIREVRNHDQSQT